MCQFDFIGLPRGDGLKISYYVRPWSYEYFQYIANQGMAAHEASFVSDFKELCDNDLSVAFYNTYGKWNGELPSGLDSLIVEDIVARDRMLRDMKGDVALRMVVSAYDSINSYLENYSPDAFISVTIDSYIIDIFKYLCGRKGIAFFGVHLTMIKDYTLITGRGELNDFRVVGAQEIEDVFKEVSSKSYSVTYVNNKDPSFVVGFKRWCRNLVKIPYFEVVRHLKSDRLNYHYLATMAVSKRRLNPGLLFTKRFFDRDWEEALNTNRKKIYIPIQFHPECNSEYWSRVLEFMPYEKSFISVVKKLSKKYQLFIKEHPEMIGLRDPAFYRELQRCNNVTIVPVGVSQERLIDDCNVSLTWNSSVGIESVMRGKPVITFANPMYAVGRCFLNIRTEKNMVELIENFMSEKTGVNESEKKAVIAKILSTSIYGHPDECFFSLKDFTKKRDAKRLSISLEEHFESWYRWTVSENMQVKDLYR